MVKKRWGIRVKRGMGVGSFAFLADRGKCAWNTQGKISAAIQAEYTPWGVGASCCCLV